MCSVTMRVRPRSRTSRKSFIGRADGSLTDDRLGGTIATSILAATAGAAVIRVHDVREMAEHLDHVILFSGDGDFRRLVEAVQRRGLRVSVVSTIKSAPPMVADELRRQADDFIELSELAPLIARNPSERAPRPAVAAQFGQREQDGELDDAPSEALMRSA